MGKKYGEVRHTGTRETEMAETIARRVSELGGRAFYVGGFVRDRLMGIQGKDVDIEIHGITPEALAPVLDSLGERTVMGASFGIFGLKHYDLDIAMPRQETATGKGHRDFQVFVDPFIGTRKAALRRDFTVNAMMEDVLTGEIIDHFGGREDLRDRILRHVDPVTFVEDPLRALRGAQFSSRFGFTLHPDTVRICARMDITVLPRERIMGELEKALVKSPRPAVFFERLSEMEQTDHWFPELAGSELTHLDKAAGLRAGADRPLYLMMAALCARLERDKAVSLIDRLTGEREMREYVLSMRDGHERLRELCTAGGSEYEWNMLYDRAVCPGELPVLCRALYGDGFPVDICHKKLEAYRELMEKPQVMGRDLVAAGMKPGESFSRLLSSAHDLHLRGVDKEKALSLIMTGGTV